MHSNMKKQKRKRPNLPLESKSIKERSNEWSDQKSANIGLYYVSYELERRGWNVLITSRNARGPDMIVYSQSGKKLWTIQVKASRVVKRPCNLGTSMVNFLMSDFAVICTGVHIDSPDLFIAKTTKIWKYSAAARNLKWKSGGNYINWNEYSQFKDNFKSLGNPYDVIHRKKRKTKPKKKK